MKWRLIPVSIVMACGMILIVSCMTVGADNSCKGAQKQAEDTLKVMDVCQQMLGCTITLEDLKAAQAQINKAAECK